MRRICDDIKPIAGAGRIFAGATLVLALSAASCSHAAGVQKGTPETPSSAAAVAGTFICHDGKRLCIGGPGATKDVAGFVRTLQEGQTYQLPKAFLHYRKNKSEAQ